MLNGLKKHCPEYLTAAAGLGIILVSAGMFTVLFDYPGSLVRQAIASPDLRRALIGLAMGITAVCLIYSPWGQQSGAHMNPAVTLTFSGSEKCRGGMPSFTPPPNSLVDCSASC